jgi:hypothetical protein
MPIAWPSVVTECGPSAVLDNRDAATEVPARQRERKSARSGLAVSGVPAVSGILWFARWTRDGSIEAEHGDERLVDGPHLVGCEPSNATPEPLGIDGTDLFDENPSRVSSD